MNPTPVSIAPPALALSRRGLLRATSLAGLALASRFGLPALSEAATTTGAPLEQQIAWFVAAVNGGGTALTEADIAAHVAPSLLAAVPPARIIGLIQGIAAGYGSLTVQGMTRPPTETQAIALLAASVGIQLALPLTIETTEPHRITGLTLYPSPPGDGKPLRPETSVNPPAALIDIGGRGLYCAEAGSGGPTVVFEAGLNDSAATWSGIVPAVAAFARTVIYDRANTLAGASDPAPMPRTAVDAGEDLRALLTAAAVPRPYVLVGHSAGGLFVRLFASAYPDDVAGLVLIDPTHEDQETRRRAMVPADLFAAEQQAIQASNTEGIDLAASFGQMRAAVPLRPIPLVVVSAGQDDPSGFPAGWPMDAERRLHHALHMDLAERVPGGRLVVAEQSGHYVQQRQPDLVVAAIRDVTRAVDDASPSSAARSRRRTEA